jgi:lipoprotein-anchoring transpeptidase ErfK/SrfK
MATPLQNKTVRPGSFTNYSYYHAKNDSRSNKTPKAKKRHYLRWLVLLAIVGVSVYAITNHSSANPANTISTEMKNKASSQKPKLTPTMSNQVSSAATSNTGECSSNTLPKLVLVSISDQHLWACQGSTELYDSPVITGIAAHPDTVTPTGTYDIYGKYTDTTLTGCDSTGCWKDPVSYWMPFLHNQYGSYGLHDATWRDPSLFGNVSPSSSNGSQGCVELPLATAAWLYNWVDIGTPVTIKS